MDKLLQQNKELLREIEDLKEKNKMLAAELSRSVDLMHEEDIGLIDKKVSHKTFEQTEEVSMYVCEKCDFRAHSTADLSTQISVKYKITNLKRLFLCDHCDFASNIEEKFKNHQENHHD